MGSFGVRTYLFALLGASTALPVILFGLAQAEHHARETSHRQDEMLISAASATAHRIGDFFVHRQRDLETLATAVGSNGTLDGDINRALLNTHFRISGAYAGTYLGDASGKAVVRVTSQGILFPPTDELHYRDRDYFRDVVNQKRTVFSRAQTGKILGEPSVQIATPIIGSDGEFLGYAEGSLDLAHLGQVLSQAASGDLRQLTLVDATGHTVLSTSSQLLPLTDVSREPLFDLAADEPLRIASRPGQGALRGAVVEVPGMPKWHVLAAAPESVIDSLVEAERRRVWWAAGLAGAAALVISAGVSAWLAARFRRVASHIKALGSDNPEATISDYESSAWEPHEFQTLQHELSLLARELASHRRSLQEQVETRTAELAHSNERLNLLIHALERAEDGIAIIDGSGKFVYVNPALQTITGYGADELLQRTASELQLDPADEPTLTARKHALELGDSHTSTFTARRKDGTFFEQECTTWPIHVQGQPRSYVTLRKDVTSQRRIEQSLRLSERMASLGTLAAGVAHEINNPLTYVLLSLRSAQRQSDRYHSQLPVAYRDKLESALDNALEGAERVSEIVKDLRLFSRCDETTIAPLDPQSVIESALRLMGNDIGNRARIERDYHPTPPVVGNHAKLHQVLLNLFINAIHAIEEAFGPPDATEFTPRDTEPQIRITTDTDANGDCVIEVSDTGTGIPPQHLERIFEPFFTTKPVGTGTGLGLALCRKIVTGMSGSITVTSEVGRGTTFRIVLPRAHAVPAPPSLEQTQRRTRVPRSRLLIVDDVRAIGASMASALSENHDVEVVDSARMALGKLAREQYDAIFCDLRMPNMHGVELYRTLLAQGDAHAEKLVFFTGGPVSETTRKFLERHGRPCLTKPVSEEQLEQALRDVLRVSTRTNVRG